MSTEQIQLEKKHVRLGWWCSWLFYNTRTFLANREDQIAISKSDQKSVSLFFLPRNRLSFCRGGPTFRSHSHILSDPRSIVSQFNDGKGGTQQPSPISPKTFHRSLLFGFYDAPSMYFALFFFIIDLATAHKKKRDPPGLGLCIYLNPYSFGAHFQMDHAWAKVIHIQFSLQKRWGEISASFSFDRELTTSFFFVFFLSL